MSGDLVRPEGERDPEGVMKRVQPGFSGQLRAASGNIALRELWYHLRIHRTASGNELRQEGWNAVDNWSHLYSGADDWWTTEGRQYFALLPSITPPEDAGDGKWHFDEDGQERPAVPDEVYAPSEEEQRDALSALTLPGSRHGRTCSKISLRRMYAHLVEYERATTAELRELFKPAGIHAQMSQGEYDKFGDWFRDVGRRNLARLPGIDPPRVGGEEWRFIGVDPDEGHLVDRNHVADAVKSQLERMDVGGSGVFVEHRREVLADAHARLREAGELRDATFVEQVDATYVGYASAEAFWQELGAPALARLPGVETPEETTGSAGWRYLSDSARQTVAKATAQ